MVLDHLVDPDNPDGVHQSFEIDCKGAAFTRVGVLGALHGKRHAVVGPDQVHPAPLDLEDLDGDIHEFLEFGKKAGIVAFGIVGSTRAVHGNDLPRSHGEVAAVFENQFFVKIGVLVGNGRELVGAALVAGNALAGPPVRGELVVVIGCAELGREFEGHQVQFLECGKVRVLPVELLALGHEVRFDGDLGFGEIERFAPVIPFEHHFHQRLEEQPHFPLELAVGPFRCRFPVPDLALVDTGLVLPEGGNSRAELDGGEDQLASAGHHHLGHLVYEHLHHLLDLLVGHALHERVRGT